MAQETNQSPVPMLCANGCGFYGNPRTNGMCSVCHKEHLSRQNNGGVSTLSAVARSPSPSPEAIQRLEVSLNNAAAAAAAASHQALSGISKSVTQQMTEMSLSCEEEGASASREEEEEELSQPVLTQPTSSASRPSTAGGEESRTPEAPKPKKNRCFMCRKKVGLTGFECRCGSLFCGLHRYSDQHNCPYDYRAEAADKIRKENPLVVADKIQRI